MDVSKPELRIHRRWWVSWWQPTEDYRPLTWPLPEYIYGYWCTGEDAQGRFSLVAWVECDAELKVPELIRKHWPEAEDWRFCSEVDMDWAPNDRFPLKHRPPTLADLGDAEATTS